MQKEYHFLQGKHTAVNVAHDAMLNGIEKNGKEDSDRMEMKLEGSKKRAELSEEL